MIMKKAALCGFVLSTSLMSNAWACGGLSDEPYFKNLEEESYKKIVFSQKNPQKLDTKEEKNIDDKKENEERLNKSCCY